MSAKFDHTCIIEDIIKSLKKLDYQLESWSLEYFKLSLLKPCEARNNLLLYILKSFGFYYSTSKIKLFNDSLIKEIASDLSSLGLCKPHDISLIRGNANREAQLKFWKVIINTSLKLKCSKNISSDDDRSLFDLVTSQHYEFSMKEEKLNLLPEDLKPLYKSLGNSIKLKERIQHLKEENLEEKKYEDNFSQREPNTENEAFNEFLECIVSLKKGNNDFLNAYESSLKPWCKYSSVPPKEYSSKTGQLASEYNEELKCLLQSVSLGNKIKNSVKIMEERMDNIKLIKQDNNPPQLLEAIINSNNS